MTYDINNDNTPLATVSVAYLNMPAVQTEQKCI